MRVRDLFENQIVPPKVAMLMAIRFYHELHLRMEEIFKTTDKPLDGFSNELNLDGEPNMRLLVSFAQRGAKLPKAALRKALLELTKKYHLQDFQPMIEYTRDSDFDFLIDVGFAQHFEVDDAAYDAVDPEVERLKLHDLTNLTLNL